MEELKEFLWGDFKTRGALYWLNRLTFATIILGFSGWVVFRFIGPSLGLYELVDPFAQPRY